MAKSVIIFDFDQRPPYEQRALLSGLVCIVLALVLLIAGLPFQPSAVTAQPTAPTTAQPTLTVQMDVGDSTGQSATVDGFLAAPSTSTQSTGSIDQAAPLPAAHSMDELLRNREIVPARRQ